MPILGTFMKNFLSFLCFTILVTYAFANHAVILDDRYALNYHGPFDEEDWEEAKETLKFVAAETCCEQLEVLISKANFNNQDVIKRIRELMCAGWRILTTGRKIFLTKPMLFAQYNNWWEGLTLYTGKDTLSSALRLSRSVVLYSYPKLRELLKIAMIRGAHNVIMLILSQKNLDYLFNDRYFLDTRTAHTIHYPAFDILTSIADIAEDPIGTANTLLRFLKSRSADIYPFTPNVKQFCMQQHTSEKCQAYCIYLKELTKCLPRIRE